MKYSSLIGPCKFFDSSSFKEVQNFNHIICIKRKQRKAIDVSSQPRSANHKKYSINFI
jgi:hypothetical protein